MDSNGHQKRNGKQDTLSAIQRERFNIFWDLWPKERRGKKGEAEAEWAKLNPDEQEFAEIMAGLKAQTASDGWIRDKILKNEAQFIPHPCRWLKHKRWTDAAQQGMTQSYGYVREDENGNEDLPPFVYDQPANTGG